jgi:integrase
MLECSTLFGLIAVTGLRINEALSLDVADVDLDARLLTVRRGKFGKAAFVFPRGALKHSSEGELSCLWYARLREPLIKFPVRKERG